MKMHLNASVMALAVAADSAPVFAQDMGEDIVVTARRQAENLQDVPVAVTALSGEALASRNVDTLDQVAAFTPNIRLYNTARQLLAEERSVNCI